MEKNTTPTESFFQLRNVFLIKDSFWRKRNIADFEALQHNVDIDIKVNSSPDGTHLIVDETLFFTSSINEEKVIDVSIEMTAAFEINGSTTIDLEQFGEINGGAIIYPFIREHLGSTCLKAGIANILLPPMNFVQRYHDLKNNTPKVESEME